MLTNMYTMTSLDFRNMLNKPPVKIYRRGYWTLISLLMYFVSKSNAASDGSCNPKVTTYLNMDSISGKVTSNTVFSTNNKNEVRDNAYKQLNYLQSGTVTAGELVWINLELDCDAHVREILYIPKSCGASCIVNTGAVDFHVGWDSNPMNNPKCGPTGGRTTGT